MSSIIRQTTINVFYDSNNEKLEDRFSRIYLKHKRIYDSYKLFYYNSDGELVSYDTYDKEFAKFFNTIGVVAKTDRSTDIVYSTFEIDGVTFYTYNVYKSDNNKMYLKIVVESANIFNHKEKALKIINNLKDNGFSVNYECIDTITETIACKKVD